MTFPIRLKKADVVHHKRWAKETAKRFGHRLGPWRKAWVEEVGGTIGRVRVNACTRCGCTVHVFPNGDRVGMPVEHKCPKDPNRAI